MRIFIVENVAVNADNDTDAEKLLEQGARELTAEEISAAGMTGYEHLVGPDTVTVGEGGEIVFSLPVVDLGQVRARKLQEIVFAVDTALAPLSAEYPYKEVLSFPTQEKEARALVEDPSAPAPLLTSIATARGIGITELARKVIARADATTAATGTVIGAAQKDKDRLEAAQSVEEVQAIVPAYKLPEVR